MMKKLTLYYTFLEAELIRHVVESVLVRNKLMNSGLTLNSKKIKVVLKTIAESKRKVAEAILV